MNTGDQAAVTAVNDTSVLTPYAGTTGEAKRVEALTINLKSSVKGVKIQYAAHVQSIGWQDFVSAGSMAGTSGLAKRVEAISIVTSGLEDAGYVLKYRAHVQSYGWMDWKTADDDGDLTISDSDDYAGTVGEAKRVEAIEIALVPTEEKALENAKDAAKAELKAIAKSDEMKARTVEGSTLNKDNTTYVKPKVDAATSTKTTKAIEEAETIEEIDSIVSEIKEDITDAMKKYLTKTVEDRYKNNKEYKNMALSDSDYDDAIDAIDEATTVAEAISAYETAMANRQNVKNLRKAATDEIKAYVNDSIGLNRTAMVDSGNKVVKGTAGKYKAATTPVDIADAIAKAKVFTTVKLDDIETAIQEAKDSILASAKKYATAKVKAIKADKTDFVLSDDDYDEAIEAIEAAATEEEAFTAYENAITLRTSAWDAKLDAVKEAEIDKIETYRDNNEDSYSINIDEFNAVIDKAIEAVNAVKITLNDTDTTYTAAYRTAETKVKAVLTTDIPAALNKADADDKEYVDNNIAARAAAVADLDKYIDQYNEVTDEDGNVTGKIGLKYTNYSTSPTATLFINQTDIKEVYTYAKSDINEADTAEELAAVLAKAKSDIYNETFKLVSDDVEEYYNNGAKSGNYYLTEANYIAAVNALAKLDANKSTEADIIAIWLTVNENIDNFVTDVINPLKEEITYQITGAYTDENGDPQTDTMDMQSTIKTAKGVSGSDTYADAIAKSLSYSTMTAYLVSVWTDLYDADTKTEAVAIADKAKTELLNATKEYVSDLVSIVYDNDRITERQYTRFNERINKIDADIASNYSKINRYIEYYEDLMEEFKYEVKFVIVDSADTSKIKQTYITNYVTANEVVAKPENPSITGYEFDKWYGEIGLSTPVTFGTNTTVSEDTVYYGKVTAATYDVTLNYNSADSEGTSLTSYVYGIGATLPKDATKSGYTLAGWYENEDFKGSPVTKITETDTGAKTYYAKWTANE